MAEDADFVLPLYFVLPKSNGTYLYFNMCAICLFMVIKNNIIKYNNNTGQNTGISKNSKNVITNEINTALIHENQNLNSGTRRANGLFKINYHINKIKMVR